MTWTPEPGFRRNGERAIAANGNMFFLYRGVSGTWQMVERNADGEVIERTAWGNADMARGYAEARG